MLTAIAIAGVIVTHIILFVPELAPVTLPPWAKSLQTTFGFAPACGLLIFCCARYRNALTGFFAWRPFVVLGEASYSIYLLHMAFFTALLLPPAASSTGNIVLRLAYLAVTIALLFLTSMSLFQILEKPARQYLRRILSVESPPSGLIARALPRSIFSMLTLCVLTAAATIATPLAANFAHAWRSVNEPDDAPDDGTIEVVAATYGASCVRIDGNATYSARRNCNGKTECDYVVRVSVIGDPAPGCSKDFRVEWRCSLNGPKRSLVLPPEAGLRSVAKLSCPAAGKS